MDSIRFALFASGTGSNALNILKYAKEHFEKIRIACLITDNPQAGIIDKVNQWNEENNHLPLYVIPFEKVEGNTYSHAKSNHERRILSVLEEHQVNWIALAGYMRILSPDFINKYYDEDLETSRILNIHPSLLPKYPGKDAYKQAFESEDVITGVTVHFVDAGVDTGRIIKQKKIKRSGNESFDEFVAKGMELEYTLYPEVLNLLESNQLKKMVSV